MKILAIETSCDETAAAVVEDGTKILSNIIASSSAMHKKYGGIVPEIAAREQLRVIIPVIKETLSIYSSRDPAQPENREVSNSSRLADVVSNNIDAIAVTVGPGFIGSLLIGVETAKTMAFVTKKPLIPVNHVIAHMYANFVEQSPVIPSPVSKHGVNSVEGSLPAGRQVFAHASSNKLRDSSPAWRDQNDKKTISFPAISLVVSGGHTELFLMESEKKLIWLGGTLDDAAGEAFDKTARLLGFENRGGVAIQEAASRHSGEQSDSRIDSGHTFASLSTRARMTKLTLPRPLLYDKTLNFSFSGLKTAVLREWKKQETHDEALINAFAYETQEAITDVLVAKTLKAAQTHHAKSILISGGVSANLRLRKKLASQTQNFQLHIPPVSLCTDNAVYIASYAYFKGTPIDWHDITALPDLSVEENI